jgi:hypothetical protein
MRRSSQPSLPAVSIEQLEQRQLMAVSPVFAGTKLKSRDVSANNIKTNNTVITVPFTGNITIADQSKIQIRGYALNPLSKNLAQVKMVIRVVSAQVVATDFDNNGVQEHQYLEITTDRLMRKGGSIIFYEGAFTDDNGDTLAEQTVRATKGQNKERFTMACRAFRPTDFTRYTPDIFASSPNPTDASTSKGETQVRSDFLGFLAKKVTLGLITQAKMDSALARFDDQNVKNVIPPPELRAALLSLVGTFAEGAIASWLDGANVTGKPYTIVTFQTPTNPDVPVAETSARPSDGRLRTVFQPKFAGEPFQVLSGWVAHEALHQDNTFSLQEEIVATTFGDLVIGQQCVVDPAFMKTGTTLVNQTNDQMLALINSGRTIFPYPGVLDGAILGKANGVLPGQKASSDGGGVYTDFDDFIRRQYIERGAPSQNTPGNALLNAYFTAVTTKTPAANMQFSDTIVNEIDAFQLPLYNRAAIQVAQALRCTLSK